MRARLFLPALLVVAAVALSGCFATLSVITDKDAALETKAYAVGADYARAQETALAVMAMPDFPDRAIAIVKAADAVASPVVQTMLIAAQEFTALREEIGALEAQGLPVAQELTGKVAIASQRLLTAYMKALPAVTKLIVSIKTKEISYVPDSRAAFACARSPRYPNRSSGPEPGDGDSCGELGYLAAARPTSG